MTRALTLCLLLLLTGCASADFVKRPPAAFQGIGVHTVAVYAAADIPRVCRGAVVAGEPSGQLQACHSGDVSFLPNPCEWTSQSLAQIYCHEFAHDNGWGVDHLSIVQ